MSRTKIIISVLGMLLILSPLYGQEYEKRRRKVMRSSVPVLSKKKYKEKETCRDITND